MDPSLVLEDFFSRSRIPTINSCSLWSSFGWSIIRNFSEGPTLSIGPFQKVQCEMVYLPYVVKKWKIVINCPKIVAYTVKIRKFLVCIISEHP